MTFTAKAYGTLLIGGLVLKDAVEGAERIFGVLKGAFECFSSPSMFMFSISYKQLPRWHGNPASKFVSQLIVIKSFAESAVGPRVLNKVLNN
jgi:hypothetical protein